jgi:hypothetical protein
MSKEFEEEVFSPSSEFHFAGGGSWVGMGFEDVEGHSADDGEVLRRIVLSGAGVVFVEDDVEGPVAVVLDAPVGRHCFETAPWGQRFGERGVVNARPDLAFGRPPGFDAPKGGEAGEGRRAGRGGDDAGLAPFLAIVSGLGLLMKDQGAACVSGLERLDGAGVERPVVGLELRGPARKRAAGSCRPPPPRRAPVQFRALRAERP